MRKGASTALSSGPPVTTTTTAPDYAGPPADIAFAGMKKKKTSATSETVITTSPPGFSTLKATNTAWTQNTVITTSHKGHKTVLPVLVGCKTCGGKHGGIVLWNTPKKPGFSFHIPGLPKFSLPKLPKGSSPPPGPEIPVTDPEDESDPKTSKHKDHETTKISTHKPSCTKSAVVDTKVSCTLPTSGTKQKCTTHYSTTHGCSIKPTATTTLSACELSGTNTCGEDLTLMTEPDGLWWDEDVKTPDPFPSCINGKGASFSGSDYTKDKIKPFCKNQHSKSKGNQYCEPNTAKDKKKTVKTTMCVQKADGCDPKDSPNVPEEDTCTKNMGFIVSGCDGKSNDKHGGYLLDYYSGGCWNYTIVPV